MKTAIFGIFAALALTAAALATSFAFGLECSQGYTANAAQDGCVCIGNSLLTATGHCEHCTAENPLADKENNRCIRAIEKSTCETYFRDTAPIFEFGKCRTALECRNDNEFQDGAGGCTTCPDNGKANEFNDSCVCNRNTERYDAERNSCEVCPLDSFADDTGRCVCTGNNIFDEDEVCIPCPAFLPMADKDKDQCRPATDKSVCETYFRDTAPILNELGGCRAALECLADDDGLTDGDGGCTNSCEKENEREVGNGCVCDGQFETVGESESCEPICETNQTRNTAGDCMDNPVASEFIIGVGGNNLTTSVEDRHEVAFENVAAIQITVATTVASFNYTKTAESSDELTVGLTDGVVGFISTVMAGDYQIFIVATNDNNIVAATIPLYLTVAAAPVVSSGSGGSSGGSAAGIIGGVVVVALALWYFTSGSDDLTWTPSYAFQTNNGNLSYSVGSRWTATANDWNLYWQTRQNGDKFVYGSGMRYNGNILSAAMNSESENDKTDLDLNLSANKTVGVWDFGGGYQFDMQLSDDATESQNRLNAKVGYIMDKWILSANANTNGKTTWAAVNYSYRF